MQAGITRPLRRRSLSQFAGIVVWVTLAALFWHMPSLRGGRSIRVSKHTFNFRFSGEILKSYVDPMTSKFGKDVSFYQVGLRG